MFADGLLAFTFGLSDPLSMILVAGVSGVVLVILLFESLGLRYIPNDRVGVADKRLERLASLGVPELHRPVQTCGD